MDEDALRAMIRDAIARVGSRAGTAGGPPSPDVIPLTAHASHYRYTLPESDGPCLIEPGVPCTHCGYCQSHGH
jgi:hypothetical protein